MKKLKSRSSKKAENQLRKDLDQMRLTSGNAGGSSDSLRGYHDYPHSLGDELRGRRASMGKGLLDVQKDLGIKPWLIVSIEKADPKSFDSPWMVTPLVKSYARYLGMDPEEAYARFQADGNSATKAATGIAKLPKLTVPSQATGRSSTTANLAILSDQGFPRLNGPSGNFKLSAKAIFSSAVVAALCAGVIYLGWTVYKGFQTIVVEPDNYQFADAGNSLVPTTTVTAQSRVRQEPPKGFDGGIGIAELNPDKQGIYAISDSDDTPGVEFADTSGLPAGELDSGAEGQIDLEQSLGGEPDRVVIVGSSEVWVRVYNQFNEDIIVKEGLLKAGEEFVVPTEGGPFFLKTGVAPNTYFRIGVSVYGPVPRDGDTVVDKIDLTVEALMAGYPHVEKIEASDEVQLYVFAEE